VPGVATWLAAIDIADAGSIAFIKYVDKSAGQGLEARHVVELDKSTSWHKI
jgi:hypothetical protein